MDRRDMTPEQRAASKALDDAIKAVMEAYEYTGPDEGLVTDWIVVVAQEGFNDDGEAKAAYTSLYPNGSLATHKAAGLLRCGMAYLDMNDAQQRSGTDDDGS